MNIRQISDIYCQREVDLTVHTVKGFKLRRELHQRRSYQSAGYAWEWHVILVKIHH